jgi:hypothetical protein
VAAAAALFSLLASDPASIDPSLEGPDVLSAIATTVMYAYESGHAVPGR